LATTEQFDGALALDGPVLSEIFQIDYLANGKLQYLFSTKNKLYIMDRNGVNLENFPVTFPSPATNGVNVLDYDNNRIYRYFVACEDKKVYAYDKEGKLMPGWNFEGTKTAGNNTNSAFQDWRKGLYCF
jgi:hypothetical protein